MTESKRSPEDDPGMETFYAMKAAYSAPFGGDIKALMADLRRREKARRASDHASHPDQQSTTSTD